MTAPTTAPVKRDRDGLIRCRVCGCTEVDPCFPPCSWVQGQPDLCSTCAVAVSTLVAWHSEARRANLAALLRELARNMEPHQPKRMERRR